MVDRKKNIRRIPLIAAALLFWIALLCPAWASTHDDDVATIQKASQAFTRVAEAAIPTVVFIKVEQTVTTSATPFHYNNPFEMFKRIHLLLWPDCGPAC
jgi:hypothetical protein